MQLAARVLVVAALVAAIAAAMTASVVLSSGSGTFFVTVIALPILVLPGLLAAWQARVRWFALWAATSLVTSVVYLIGGDPYEYERELGGWDAFEVAVWIVMGLCTIGAMTCAFYAAARRRSVAELATPLARRLRHVVRLCIGLALVCVVFCFLPGERVYAGRTFLYERSAGGGYLVVFLALLLVPGVLVYRDPRKRWAWLWMAWALPASLLVLAVVLGIHIFTHGEDLWPIVIVRTAALGIISLLVVAVPAIALSSSDTTLPEARISTS